MKVIVLGNGNAGSYIYKYISQYRECICLNRKHFNAIDNNYSFLSFIDEGDVVINCVGILKPKIKKVGIENTFLINSVFPNKVYEFCKQKNAHFFHICSDCVFKGDIGNYTEDDIRDATDIYALSKSLVNNGIILRTSFIGSNSGLLKWVLSNKNGEIDGYDNCFWNGITALQLARVIYSFILNDFFKENTYHIACENVISKYELCLLINDIYNLNIKINKKSANCIEGTKINGILDRSLKSLKLIVHLPYIKNQLIDMKKFDNENS